MAALTELRLRHIWQLYSPVLSFVMLCGPSIPLRILTWIELVQRRGTRWIKSSFDPATLRWIKSGSECLNELRWPSLELRCNYMCIVLLYAILHNFTPIKFSGYFQLNDFSTHSHPLTILPFPSSINAFCYSFFVNSVFFWNSISFDVLSAPLNHFCFDCNVICVCMFVLT